MIREITRNTTNKIYVPFRVVSWIIRCLRARRK